MLITRPSAGWRTLRWTTWRLLLATVVGLLAVVGTAGAAGAHTDLAGSSPANGATVGALSSVTLRFADPLLENFGDVLMTTEDDQPVALSPPVVTSEEITATIAGPPPRPGLYIVTYRAVAVDGHTITGSLAFTLDPAAVDGSGEPAAAGAATSAAPPATVSQGAGSGTLAAMVGIPALLLAGTGLWAASRRRATGAGGGPADAPAATEPPHG